MTSPTATVLRPLPLTYRSGAVDRPAKSAGGRALWLDAFRGFTMLWLVSRGFGFPRLKEFAWAAPVATQFDHVPWVGLAAWDLVQPFFMFIVGAAMPFAFARRRAAGGSWVGGLPHALRRSLLLLFWSHVVMIGSGAKFDWQLINESSQTATIVNAEFRPTEYPIEGVPATIAPKTTVHATQRLAGTPGLTSTLVFTAEFEDGSSRFVNWSFRPRTVCNKA